jgi:hypothetical protein
LFHVLLPADTDIMQLLDSIGPEDAKAPACSSTGQGSFQQVQQLQQEVAARDELLSSACAV